MANYKHYCAACDLRAQCEYTFGKFYADKSSNETGCNHKIHPFDLARITECAAVVRPADVAAKNAATSTAANKDAKVSRADILERLKNMRVGRNRG